MFLSHILYAQSGARQLQFPTPSGGLPPVKQMCSSTDKFSQPRLAAPDLHVPTRDGVLPSHPPSYMLTPDVVAVSTVHVWLTQC